jgi:hypothetical protein
LLSCFSQDRELVQTLKLWRLDAARNRFVLNTRVDCPHKALVRLSASVYASFGAGSRGLGAVVERVAVFNFS